MTRVPLSSRVEIEATRADLSLGVDAEVARSALRRRLAGEYRHLQNKHVPRARGPQPATCLGPDTTRDNPSFYRFERFPRGFMLSIIVGLLGLLRVGSRRIRLK
jgi:hypothetical protein